MSDHKIEGLPPVTPHAPELARGHDEADPGRTRGRTPDGQGYDAKDATGSAPQTLNEGRGRPKTSDGLSEPRTSRAPGGKPSASKPELDGVRRDVQARGLKGKAADSCVTLVSDVAATLGLPVREVSRELVALLDAVGPQRWEFALEGLESTSAWARKRGLELSSVTGSLLMLIAKEGADSAYDALADFVSVGVVTRDSRTSIADATRALIAFLDVEGVENTAIAQEDLRLACVATKGASQSFATLAAELHAKLAAAAPDARDGARKAFAAAHRAE
jgi:hypothetical protein